MSLEQLVEQFNSTYCVPVYVVPTFPNEAEATRLNDLIHEELIELNEALDNGDIIEMADALTDILYVTAQQMRVLGLPVDALLREVQRSNMSKLGEDGHPIFREDGKVLKGPKFSPPNLRKVLEDHGYGG